MKYIKRFKEITMMEKKVLCVFVVLILLVIAFCYVNPDGKRLRTWMKTPEVKNKQYGVLHRDFQEDSKQIIACYYPKVGKEKIDRAIENKIEVLKSEFKEKYSYTKTGKSLSKKNLLKIDYESYLVNGEYYSVLLKSYETIPASNETKVDVYTFNFALSNEKKLQLKEVLKSRYLNTLSTIANQSLKEQMGHFFYKDVALKKELQPEKGNFEKFIVKAQGIEVYLSSYPLFYNVTGNPNFTVPYEKLIGYVALDDVLQNQDQKDRNKKRVIDPSRPMVALTYDDGPHLLNTPKILDILKKNNAVATFFMLGNRVQGRESVLQKMVEQGCELGNHSFDHKQLTKLNSAAIDAEIQDPQNAVYNAVGIYPSVLRPPYGDTDVAVRSQLHMPVILWDVDTEDWKNKNTEETVRRALVHVKDGDIILMHDIQDSTVAATERIVNELNNKGIQMVTVTELFKNKGIRLENGAVYRKADSLNGSK